MLGYGRQSIDDDDVAAVVAALRSERITQGPRAGVFESALCEATGARHAVALSHGTAALHVANLTLGVGPGRRVVTSANTFVASATAAVACGAEVGFVDVEPSTANMDLDLLERELERGPVHAVVPVHFAGLPVDMARLIALKRRHGFRIVEDASHALGARYEEGGRLWRVGEHPEVDATVLSFHPVKHVTTAEGGALLTHDDRLAAHARRLANHGVEREPDEPPFPESRACPRWFAPMVEPGFNYRLSELHAALGVSQLAKLPAFVARRRALAAAYSQAFDDLGDLERPHAGDAGREHAWHLYVVRVEPELRDGLMEHLDEQGIATQVHYYPVPLQPWFRARLGDARFPNAAAHARSCLSLPLHPALTDDDQARVIDALRAWRSGA
ncbi:MAG: UDP-4-amino-4,6-dideoxy-N-acetyl-beta-L-altrosamine transaminase [Planctomycetota bacterium]|nr:UDP-4-amino-4,6-dideoxy-N-acetyl-beta-L-altrosamine transaminase [Planctomycetota bacterium]